MTETTWRGLEKEEEKNEFCYIYGDEKKEKNMARGEKNWREKEKECGKVLIDDDSNSDFDY